MGAATQIAVAAVNILPVGTFNLPLSAGKAFNAIFFERWVCQMNQHSCIISKASTFTSVASLITVSEVGKATHSQKKFWHSSGTLTVPKYANFCKPLQRIALVDP